MKTIGASCLFVAVVLICGSGVSVLSSLARLHPGVTPEGRRSRVRAILLLAAAVIFVLLGALALL
jgi:hypothetical protein